MALVIRQATVSDIDTVSLIFREAADWLDTRKMPLWRTDELLPARIAADVAGGLFYLAISDGDPAGTLKCQLSDPEFWPDLPEGDSAFVQRLTVRRRFAGGAVSTALLSWAVAHAAAYGRSYLRLDCAHSRPRLRAIYERFGFRHHSDRQVGPHFVARYELPVADTLRARSGPAGSERSASGYDAPHLSETVLRVAPTELRTGRVRLRQWRTTDRERFRALNADPRVMAYFPRVLLPEETDALADRIEAHIREYGWGLWAVEIPGVTSFAGFIGFAVPRFDAHFTPCVEIGWRLAADVWGRGYATEGARAALAFGFAALALPEVVSFTVPANVASRRVMERLDMRRDPQDDFDHPGFPIGHDLRRHVLYRIRPPSG